MRKRYFPLVKDSIAVVVITALAFLLLTATCIELRTSIFMTTCSGSVLQERQPVSWQSLLPVCLFAVSL